MTMKFVRMKPGHGDVLLAEGDPEVSEDEERLIEEFRRQLDEGMWAAVPSGTGAGRREATMVRDFSEVPRDADRVIFFPKAAGG
jgi:molybdopterin converting factor small subunit